MIPFPTIQGGFKTVYADPAWPEYGGGQIKRGADRHYPLMKVTEIIHMGGTLRMVLAPNAHLYLWATNNYLEDGFRVARAWGFIPKTCITWVKDRMGLGQYFRGTVHDPPRPEYNLCVVIGYET